MTCKYLVIVESPNKVKKIKGFLGPDYEVTASVGHVRDLPAKKLGVNIKKNFEPTYEIYPDKTDVVKNIITKAKKVDVVYLLTDGDREGEGISQHIVDLLPKNTRYRRAVSNSITKPAILKAIAEAGDINHDLVNAYECRRILDRLAGYKTSYTVKQATGGISAGRVQSAALCILAEREKAIQAFVPQEYWPIEAKLKTDKDEIIIAKIKKPDQLEIKTGKEAREIIRTLMRESPIEVSLFDRKEVAIKPYAPFITSTMQQSASAIFGWKPDKTMSVAQELYEAGKVTYHRTDSTFIVPEFLDLIRQYIQSEYGHSYLAKTINIFGKSKSAQEAHEAIRMTDINVFVALGGQNRLLYPLVWERAIASQMADMKQLRSRAEFTCKNIILSASGSKVLFDGWRKVWKYGEVDDTDFPELQVGQRLKVVDVKTEQKFTEPPKRFTPASFIRHLEKLGIGRPSTYASIPKTLEARKYIEIKKNITVTNLGLRVSDFLVASDFCFVDTAFTADLENKLDNIANNKLNKVETLRAFWDRLKKDIDNANVTKKKLSKTGISCPKCNGELLKKHSKFGPFYSCENWNNKEAKCDYTAKIGEDGEPIERVEIKIVESEFKCPNCSELLIIRQGKRGEYLGCRNWTKEDCKGFYDAETGKKIQFKKKKFRKRKS